MAEQIMRFSCNQAAVTLIALVALVGVIVCAMIRIPVPEILNVALTTALGAQFGMTLPAARNATRIGGRE